MKNLLMFAFGLLLVSSVYAESYSLINFDIQENGETSLIGTSSYSINISGIQNINGKITGKSQELTGKQGEEWYFGVKLEFPSSINVILPENAVLTGIQTNSTYNIGVENQRVVISLISESPEIYLSYKIEDVPDFNYFWYVLIFIILIILAVVLFLNKKNKKETKTSESPKSKKIDKLKIMKDVLNEREKIILNKLKEYKKNNIKIKQSQLSKAIGIPKASLSRHIQELENKKLIKRYGEGKNKFVELN